MKLNRHAVLLCGSSFLAGVILSSICWLMRTQVHSVSGSVVSSRPLAQDPPLGRAKEPDELGGLTDEKYLTKLNGTRLKLNYGSWAPAVDIPSFIQTSRIFPLATGGLLVGLEDTLYRLNEAHEVVWKYQGGQPINDYAIVESTGLIYITAGDNVMVILDAVSGKRLHRDSRNGSAAYGVTENYANDMCLVTDNFRMYREKARDIPPRSDGITCWRGRKALWHQAFPADAQLVVNGDRIVAVTKTRTGIYVNEIHPPDDAK
jgi:hypothetical protein